MIFGLFSKRTDPEAARAEAVHAAIVAQARQPFLYRDLGVPDSLPGRFEAIVLHAALYLRRLRAEGPQTKAFAQSVFDATFRALDADLRQIGVGDLAVPKRMKAMTRSFFDGAKAYDAALDAGDGARLGEAIARIFHGGAPADPLAPERLAAYALRAAEALEAQPIEALLTQGPVFPHEGEAR